jgi:L-lysine 6-transaminase
LFAAFDLPSCTERDHAWGKMMENNLLILTSGDQAIRFRPHLNVSTEDIDTAMDIITISLKDSLR